MLHCAPKFKENSQLVYKGHIRENGTTRMNAADVDYQGRFSVT